MPGTLGVTIGEKHTLKDWNLGWTAITLGFPEPKTYELDIQGADGTLDITEAVTGGDVKTFLNGDLLYRTLQITWLVRK